MDETLAFYKLKTGQEIDEEDFKKIKLENDQKVAFDMAISYLEKYSVTRKGVSDYLKKKNFDAFVVASTLKKLEDYQILNDEKFAQNYFETISQTNGKRAVANKLRQKGVSQEIVDKLIENVQEEDEIERALVLANKFVKNRENNAKNYQKCIAHLLYKGYDYSVALEATKNALNYKGEEDDWVWFARNKKN